MDDSDPAWPPALARNSRLSPPSARSPLTAQARTGSAHHLIGPPAPDRLSLPLSLCLFVCALNSRARSLLSFSLPCPVMLPSQRLACMITPGHGRPTQHGPSHPARSTRAVCTPHRPRPDPPALVGARPGLVHTGPRHMCSRSLSCFLHLRIHGPSLSSSLACGARKAG